MDAAAEIEEIGVAEKLPREFLDFRVALEDRFDLVRDARQFLHQSLRGDGRELAAHLAEMKSGEQERGELAGESLRGGDADFRAGVGEDGAVGFAREHRAHHVADGENFGAFLAGFAFGGERVGGFAGLADGDREAVLVDDGIAIAEFAAVIDFDGKMRQPLDHEFAGKPGVPAGAAGDDFDFAEILEIPAR